MPIYEYRCEECGQEFERIQKFSDPLVTTCDACGGPVKKLISNTSFVLKGSGWYITDYARAGQEKKSQSEKGSSAERTEKESTKGEKQTQGSSDSSASSTKSSTGGQSGSESKAAS